MEIEKKTRQEEFNYSCDGLKFKCKAEWLDDVIEISFWKDKKQIEVPKELKLINLSIGGRVPPSFQKTLYVIDQIDDYKLIHLTKPKIKEILAFGRTETQMRKLVESN